MSNEPRVPGDTTKHGVTSDWNGDSADTIGARAASFGPREPQQVDGADFLVWQRNARQQDGETDGADLLAASGDANRDLDVDGGDFLASPSSQRLDDGPSSLLGVDVWEHASVDASDLTVWRTATHMPGPGHPDHLTVPTGEGNDQLEFDPDDTGPEVDL